MLGLLDGLDEGSFLVRRRGAVGEEHVLSVVHKGKPSHHLIKQTQDGTWSLNGKVYGQPATIHEVSLTANTYRVVFNINSRHS